ncbi:MAG: hypothetical protein ACRD1L_03355, partial [Terriglobales bacterium]
SKYRGVSTEARMALRSYQEELFGPGPTPETAALARALELPPRAFSRAVEHYVAAASQHPAGQQLMPGFAAGTPQEALAEMLGPEGVRPPHYLLPAGEPTPVEAADALPRPVYLDTSMRPPVLYLDTDGIGALASLARAAGVTMVTSFRGIYLRPNLVRRLAAAEPDSDLAREVNQAAAQAPGGLAVVSFPGNLTPEMRRRARLEEAGHGWQSDADYGDPDGALSPQRAIALAMLDSAVRVRVGAIYRKALEGLPLLQQARLLASEIGVRLLIGDYADLGLSEGEGAFMARLWLLWVREEVGDEGLARAQAESGSDVAERARELGAPSHAGGGGAAGGAAGRRLDRGPDDGGDTGGRFLPAARGAVLREPERGPAAALFRLWDRATAPVARGAARLGAGISKYRGVSTEARVALRSYGGRARFAALLSERLAREGYEHVADLGYPTAEAGAAATLRLEHHLEQPQDPRFAPRNRMEQRLSDWARQTLDATTVHEVTRGGLTPDALLAGPGHGAVSLDSLDAAERARLERSLADWQRAKADPQVPRSPLKSAPDCCCGATPNSDWPRPMGRHGAGAMSA